MGSAPEDIVDALIRDMTDRRGFRQQWDECDGEVRAEIRQTWIDIVSRMLLGGTD